jgi:DNA-binding GntR family transcriptional regulator
MEDWLIAELSQQIRHAHSPREDLVERVAKALREQIAGGRLKPGTKLASEVELAAALEISRPTLREAVRSLARDGLLRIKHGVGTFVTEESNLIWARLDSMRSMTDLIRSVGGVPGDRSLSIERIVAEGEIATALDVSPGAPVGCIGRIRLINERPVALANEYVSLGEAAMDFACVQAFGGGSLYEFLRRTCKITLSHSSLAMTAASANASQASRLDVPRRTPLLLMRETHYDLSGKPVLYTVNLHNSHIVEFTLARIGLRT